MSAASPFTAIATRNRLKPKQPSKVILQGPTLPTRFDLRRTSKLFVLSEGVGIVRNSFFETGSFFFRQGLCEFAELDYVLVNGVLR